MFIFLTLLFSVLCWGPSGHKIVAEVAHGLISDSTKTNMEVLLPNGLKLNEIAPNVDDFSHTEGGEWNKPYHYIDAQGTSFVSSRDCPGPANACVWGAVLNYTAKLNVTNYKCQDMKDPKPGDNPEPCYLEYLTHFTADITQPLHVTDENIYPQGGNKLMVKCEFLKQGSRTYNLHKVWDDVIINEYLSRECSHEYNWGCWADKIKSDLIANDYALFKKYTSNMDPSFWASDTMQVGMGDVNDFDRKTMVLNETYYEMNWPNCDLQLAKAAARLTVLLNQKLG